ncbi:methyl-accepting chemotaxis protein [Cellulosilyticum sp. I15G10I2]|uniref:methyl-accepting chemotaxis protein n=1 Tax=Cellulosilyticum sp. I15G10I2 TaxID=1892843 RepID=UPI00085C464C|nr:methyl-accepting chemotaxis protein [Cellulosilyticum sp. I15G10I2]
MKKRKIKDSLVAKGIISNMLIVMLVAITIVGISYFKSSDVLTQEIEKQLDIKLHTVTNNLLKEQAIIQNQLTLLGDLETIKEFAEQRENEQEVRHILELFKKRNEEFIENIFIADRQGNVILDDKGAVDHLNIAERTYFQEGLDQKVGFSEILTSKMTGNLIQVISLPLINSQNKTIGVICASIPMNYIYDILREVKIGEMGYAYLIDQEGTFLYHPKDELIGTALKDLGIPELSGIISSMTEGQTGEVIYTFDSMKKLNLYTAIGSWSLSINAAHQEFLAPVNNMRDVILIVSSVFLVLGIIGSALNSYVMVRKIQRMKSAMHTAANGDLTIAVKESGLRPCWEIKKCNQRDCIAYKNDNLKCWEISGTLCDGEIQEDLITKLEKCKQCDTYKLSEGDDINQIGRSLNTMIVSIRSLVASIQQTAMTLTHSSEELSGASEESSSAASEIAKRMNEVSASTEEQSQFVESVDTIAKEMNTHLDQSVESILRMSKRADEVNETAVNGQDIIRQAINEMIIIKQHSEKTVEVMQTLNQQSKEISAINDLITQIAEQTNLLALNAAIEAARAGEQGRGFAVVAEEVRKLAFQAQNSAQSISDLIGLVQKEIYTANNLIIDENKKVEHGIGAVQKSASALNDINEHVQEVVQDIKSVVDSINITKDASQRVTYSVANIVMSMQESVSSSEEITATTQEQTSIAEGIAQSAGDLSKMSEELLQIISKFIIKK